MIHGAAAAEQTPGVQHHTMANDSWLINGSWLMVKGLLVPLALFWCQRSC